MMYPGIAQKIGYVALVACFAYTSSASAFSWRDDPSSTNGGDGLTTASISGNVYTVKNYSAENLTDNFLPELGFIIPFAWPKDDLGNRFPMDGQADGSWYTSDYSSTGVSLTITETTPGVGSVLMGDVADLTGTQQLPLEMPCLSTSSPSCLGAPWPHETRNASDQIPFFSLGAFGPHEVKHFDISFTYNWGDHRVGDVAMWTSFSAYTVSPIPEPETYAMLLAGLGLMGFINRRKRIASTV